MTAGRERRRETTDNINKNNELSVHLIKAIMSATFGKALD
jgi:hypothetical protein